MQITTIQLDDFAGLKGRLDFAPGLNLVVGPNEAGKSRLVAALHYGLCGRVKKRGRGVDPLERFRPWHMKGTAFRLSLTLKLANGHTIEVSQNLDEPGRSRVTDIDLGRELTSELIVDRAPDASRLLGLDRDVVPKTLLVSQGDLLAVRDGADTMQSMLQRAATGTVDETANAALARLDTFRTERIGTEHASSKRPLRLARDLEVGTRRSLDELRALHASLGDERVTLVSRRAELARWEDERRIAKTLELHDETTRLERLVTRLDTIDLELARLDGLLRNPLTEGPESNADQLLWIERELTALRDTPPPSAPSTPCPEGIETELAALPPTPEGDLQPTLTLERLEQAHRVARDALERHQLDAVEDVARPAGVDAHTLREYARELATPPPAVPEHIAEDDPRGARLVAIIGLTLGLIALGIGIGVVSTAAIILGLAVVAFGTAMTIIAQRRQRFGLAREAKRRAANADLAVYLERRQQTEATLRRAGLTSIDVTALETAARRYEHALDAHRARDIWESQRDSLEARLRIAESALREALAEQKAPDWATYIEACRNRQRLMLQARRRGDLEQLLVIARHDHAAYAAAASARDKRLAELERAATELGVALAIPRESVLTRDLFTPLEARIAELRTHAEARGRRRELISERVTLLGPEDKAVLAERLETLRAELAHTAPINTRHGVSSLELEGRIAALQREVAQREASLAEKLRGLPSIAELEERLDLAQREHARLRRLDRLIAQTIEQLMLARDTIHRDIAPRLSAKLSAVIPRLTGGRWERARIAVDDLAVSVLRDHDWWPAHDLSYGTAEQIYLALRIVLATTLAKADEPPPLILDDVLIHADADRKAELLDWLAELAEHHQIILTSHDSALTTWIEASGGKTHELR